MILLRLHILLAVPLLVRQGSASGVVNAPAANDAAALVAREQPQQSRLVRQETRAHIFQSPTTETNESCSKSVVLSADEELEKEHSHQRGTYERFMANVTPPIYRHSNGDFYMFYVEGESMSMWRVGKNYETKAASLSSNPSDPAVCPSNVVNWYAFEAKNSESEHDDWTLKYNIRVEDPDHKPDEAKPEPYQPYVAHEHHFQAAQSQHGSADAEDDEASAPLKMTSSAGPGPEEKEEQKSSKSTFMAVSIAAGLCVSSCAVICILVWPSVGGGGKRRRELVRDEPLFFNAGAHQEEAYQEEACEERRYPAEGDYVLITSLGRRGWVNAPPNEDFCYTVRFEDDDTNSDLISYEHVQLLEDAPAPAPIDGQDDI